MVQNFISGEWVWISYHKRWLNRYVEVRRRGMHLHVMMHVMVDMLPVTGKNMAFIRHFLITSRKVSNLCMKT